MKTKKFVFPLAAVIVILVIVLVACGAKSTQPLRKPVVPIAPRLPTAPRVPATSHPAAAAG